jgi:nicotinamidase-related amidase
VLRKSFAEIKALLFADVNTDRCVLAIMLDAAQQDFDTIMLRDACGTVSPSFAQDMVWISAKLQQFHSWS